MSVNFEIFTLTSKNLSNVLLVERPPRPPVAFPVVLLVKMKYEFPAKLVGYMYDTFFMMR